MDELHDLIGQWIDAEIEREKEVEQKYPSDVPNNVAKHGFIRGYLIENSFGPAVGDYNYLCRIGLENLYVWTHNKNEYSALVSETDLEVKSLPYWITASYLIWLSRMFYHAFEGATDERLPDYKWMYYFDPYEITVDQVVFYGLSDLESH